MAKNNLGDYVTKAAIFGFAGWILENAVCGDRFSGVFGGGKVPFLPIYAANGIALTSLSSYVSNWPTLGRGLAYATLGTAIDYAGCQIDRKLLSQRAGQGGGFGGSDSLFHMSDGCVNFMRSVVWGGMGLISEKFA